MATKYELRCYANSRDPDVIEALNIYSRETPACIYTNSNEIIYWLENYRQHSPDQFFILGFYVNDKVAGFAQLIYMSDVKIIFFDYMAIARELRGINSFYEFVAQIKCFIESKNIEYNYVVVESPFMNHDKAEPSVDAILLIRLLKMQGFGVIKAPYFQPAHGVKNKESEMKGFLLIYSKNKIKDIKRDTYLNILSTIIFKHYGRWYEPFENDSNTYSKYLETLYQRTIKMLSKADVIGVNGYKQVEPVSSQQNDNLNITYVFFLVLLATISAVMAVVCQWMGINLFTVAIFWLLLLGSLFALMAVFGKSKDAFKIFQEIMKMLNRLFHKER
jgi:hypothetical protein